jgi:superfamily II DNA or RNA helicase
MHNYNIKLRPYQSEGIDQIARNFSMGYRRQVFQLPTGAGKTITFAALIARYLEKFPKSIVVCVHREELLDQTRKTLYNGFGIDSEAIKAGRKHIPQSRVYVAMVETMNNMLKNRPIWAAHIGCLVVDEVHIANFNKLYDYFDKSLIIGFTATPIAASKKDPLKNYYDQIVVGPQIEELIDMGSLCENITYGIKGIDTKKFGVKRGEFDNEVMGNEFSKSKNVQNCVDKYLEKGEGKKAIVFNCNVLIIPLISGYNFLTTLTTPSTLSTETFSLLRIPITNFAISFKGGVPISIT